MSNFPVCLLLIICSKFQGLIKKYLTTENNKYNGNLLCKLKYPICGLLSDLEKLLPANKDDFDYSVELFSSSPAHHQPIHPSES